MKNVYEILVIIGVTLLFAVLYTILCPSTSDWKGLDNYEDKTILDKFFNRLYFSLTTMTTIGYGDVVPKTKKGRLLSMGQMIAFILKILYRF